MEPCKACGTLSELRHSHVIPEWAYKSVYTKKHKFAVVSANSRDRILPEQKGWRERLLCGKCETYLSKLENNLLQDVKYIRSGIRQVLTRADMIVSFSETTLPSYNNFKRAVLSVLWRMAISTRNEFKNYSLQEHEPRIRDYIFNPNTKLKWAAYPIVLFRLTIGQKLDNGIMMLYPETTFAKGIAAKSFAIHGLQFTIYLYEPTLKGTVRSQIASMESIALKESGKLTVADLDIVQMIRPGKLFSRLLAADVKAFYKRYS